MKVQVVFTDLETDGAVPICCEITTSDNHSGVEFLNLKFDNLNFEISVPLYQLGLVLGGEEHG